MNVERNPFILGECERCGASLKKSKQKGKYICEYCRAVYFDSNYSENDWEEDIDEVSIDVDDYQPPTSATTYNENKKKIVLPGAIILSAIGVFLCVIMVIAGSITNRRTDRKPNTSSSNEKQSIEKPQMLVTLPKAVKAGKAVAYKNWEIVVSPEFTVANNRLAFAFSLQSWHDSNQILSYEPKTIIVYDNVGKVYPINLGRCEPDLPYLTRQLTFSPYEKMSFSSNSSWCNTITYIPTYSGVIMQDVNNLYLHFEDFGVFKNITFVFDL
ncbi:MAG TPA: hypothetical protein DCL08_07340 [Anaerolineaceae bacterium]|nr:hypothetical protein [Anaerolineaceae bacterium]